MIKKHGVIMKTSGKSISLDQELEGVYRRHGEAWGGPDAVLRCTLQTLVGCADRVIRFKSEHGERSQRFNDDSHYKKYRRSDAVQNLAMAVCSLEQAAVFLGALVGTYSPSGEAAQSMESSAETLVATLVRTAMRVSEQMNLRENCYREGLEEPSGQRLGADCLAVAAEIRGFVDVLARDYPADVEDYESYRLRKLDIYSTNLPETKYVLREPIVDSPESSKTKAGMN